MPTCGEFGRNRGAPRLQLPLWITPSPTPSGNRPRDPEIGNPCMCASIAQPELESGSPQHGPVLKEAVVREFTQRGTARVQGGAGISFPNRRSRLRPAAAGVRCRPRFNQDARWWIRGRGQERQPSTGHLRAQPEWESEIPQHVVGEKEIQLTHLPNAVRAASRGDNISSPIADPSFAQRQPILEAFRSPTGLGVDEIDASLQRRTPKFQGAPICVFPSDAPTWARRQEESEPSHSPTGLDVGAGGAGARFGAPKLRRATVHVSPCAAPTRGQPDQVSDILRYTPALGAASASGIPDVDMLRFQGSPICVSPIGGPPCAQPLRGRTRMRSRRPGGGRYTISKLAPDGSYPKCRSTHLVDSAVSASRWARARRVPRMPHQLSLDRGRQRAATNVARKGRGAHRNGGSRTLVL